MAEINEQLLNSMVESMQVQTKAISMLLKERTESDLHTKTPANFGTYTELHGNGSLFGSFPVERDIITAHIRPLGGLVQVIPRLPSVTEQPIFASITGFTGDVGDEPAYPCSDNPSGYMKGCNISVPFGRYARDTQTLEMDKLMLKFNRGDFTDLMLRGQLLSGNTFDPIKDVGQMLNTAVKSEMVIAGVNLERKIVPQVWQGNPANNNAGGGYKEFPGLDRQIATGIVDWHTNTACPALDSDVKNFAYSAIDGTTRDIVEYLSMLEYYLVNNAEAMGLNPVQWVLVMRPQLWHELSAVWPCRYLSNRCANQAGTSIGVINDNVNVDLRDKMRQGKYIDINGTRYPVITDQGIFEHNSTNNGNLIPGQYASTIYMVPLTITAGFPVTYLEYVNYAAAAANIALLQGTEPFWWSDNGMYSWAMEYVKWCFKASVKTEPRIVLRTPQLAGRIDAVMYEPLQHVRDFDPTSSYFKDGGVSLRADSTGFHVW